MTQKLLERARDYLLAHPEVTWEQTHPRVIIAELAEEVKRLNREWNEIDWAEED